MNYWAYTFSPGFSLITIVVLLWALMFGLLCCIVEMYHSAIAIAIIWAQFQASCMVGYLIRFKRNNEGNEQNK